MSEEWTLERLQAQGYETEPAGDRAAQRQADANAAHREEVLLSRLRAWPSGTAEPDHELNERQARALAEMGYEQTWDGWLRYLRDGSPATSW